MLIKKKSISFLLLIIIIITANSCIKKDRKLDNSIKRTLTSVQSISLTSVLDNKDYKFPVDSSKINGWVKQQELEKIHKHGWGIWKGLTSFTNQKSDGSYLRIYETWLTPQDILDSIRNKPVLRVGRANLNKPHQFTHAKKMGGTLDDTDIVESVSYNPAASNFAIKNKLFLATTLAKYMYKEGRSEIPNFPNNAITIKPVYKIVTKEMLDKDSIFTMASWHGPTSNIVAFPEKDWKSCVHVDIKKTGISNKKGKLDINCNDINMQNTFSKSDFIHYVINTEDAEYYNKNNPKTNAKSGDIALLVGMHVGTREIKRWTWQTFWWTPNPEVPPSPSSSKIASARIGANLDDAANHYAMAVAYSMITPVQPYIGGKNVGSTVIAFNPYLEAGFGPNVFKGSKSYVYNKNGDKIKTNAGVKTNCMSCHAYAAYNILNPNDGTPYSGDAYVSLNDSLFTKKIKLDFAWSVQQNIDTTGLASYLKTILPLKE